MNQLEINLYVEKFYISLRNKMVEESPDIPYDVIQRMAEEAANNYRKGFVKAIYVCGGQILES